MRLPTWLRPRHTRRTPGEVVVTLGIGAGAFVGAMHEATEEASNLRYRLRIQYERALGQAHVNELLDQMCRDLGLDPITTWRIPRAQEHRDRERARLYAELHAADRPTREEAERAWLTAHRTYRESHDQLRILNGVTS